MNGHTLYVATGNAGKLRDFALAAAAESAGNRESWNIVPLPNLRDIAPPAEDGTTFHENAGAKALYYAQYAPGALVLADDSGLSVDALGGAPGVYSARYADQLDFPANAGATLDEWNNACLLAQFARVHAAAPVTAQYTCVLAAARSNQLLLTAEGSVAGEILTCPRGTGGFGYDPLFLLPGPDRTMAELDGKTRLGLSHRGAALRRLLPQLAALL